MAVHIDSEGLFLYFDEYWGCYQAADGHGQGIMSYGIYNPIKLGEY